MRDIQMVLERYGAWAANEGLVFIIRRSLVGSRAATANG